MRNVVITGVGIKSCIGNTYEVSKGNSFWTLEKNIFRRINPFNSKSVYL